MLAGRSMGMRDAGCGMRDGGSVGGKWESRAANGVAVAGQIRIGAAGIRYAGWYLCVWAHRATGTP